MSANVLIIDAEEEFTSQLTDALGQLNVEATATSDGKAGLDLAHINIPVAIVLCVELPGVSGYTICNKLKKDATLKSVPVVLTSSEATEQTFANHKKLRTRADEYLKKPFPPALLVEILTPHLGEILGAPDEEIPIDEDIAVDVAAPETMSDDEVFSAEEAASMDAPGQAAEEDGPFADALAASVGAAVPQRVDEDSEALTTVGMLDPMLEEGDEAAGLRAELERMQALKDQAERERDEAIADQKAAEAHVEAMGKSSRPSMTPSPAAGSSRELLELKKERNAIEKELITLRDELNKKERDLVDWRDKETELDGRIVELEEANAEFEHAKNTAEALAAGARAKAEELKKTLDAQNEDLKARLGESNARASELDGAVQELTRDLKQVREELTASEASASSAQSEVDSLTSSLAALQTAHDDKEANVARLENELGAANAESNNLRDTIRGKEAMIAELNLTNEGQQAQLAEMAAKIDGLEDQVRELSGQAESSAQNLFRAEEVRNKALKAMDIAQALLREAGYNLGEEGGSTDDVVEVDLDGIEEART